ncbi:MAG: NAD(P) transhydrogenase subunit alpha [Acidimicrobiia bacterium]
MHLGIRNEANDSEHRVAVSPASAKAFIELGVRVSLETNAGAGSGFTDEQYAEAGADIVDALTGDDQVNILVTVTSPPASVTNVVANGGVVVGLLEPNDNLELLRTLNTNGVQAVTVDRVPRSTLAQAMDVLSSQATAAGYAAVLLGATELPKFMPMLVTAAGTVPPAQVLVLGVGVAGLQAIATAKRLGAVVYAYDIRPETREQVESLGGRFVDAPTQEMDEGGYARAVDDATAQQQREILAGVVADSDLVITTAQVPGRQAPRLVERTVVERMSPGSVVVDMAAGSGGNVEGSAPDEVVDINGVRVFGPTDLASRVAADASRMYARNLLELVKRMITEEGELVIDADDDVVGPALVSFEGMGGAS